MRILVFIIALVIGALGIIQNSFAANDINDINVRNTDQVIINRNEENGLLWNFIGPIRDYFYAPDSTNGDQTIPNVFLGVSSTIKNFFIAVAVVFLIIGIIKLLFAWGDEEAQKKWKNNIIWVSVGVFVMQIAYSVWSTLYLRNANGGFDVNGNLAWMFWGNILEPIVNIMLVLASFGFIAMAVYAFYTIITGGGDEEKLKKWRNVILYAIVGFILIRIPKILVTAIYGKPTDGCEGISFRTTCEIGAKNLGESINIFGKILTYINGFLALFAVVMVIYAGYLIFISGGDEEKLKKAKKTMIYIALGVILLVWSQAIFRFFFLQG